MWQNLYSLVFIHTCFGYPPKRIYYFESDFVRGVKANEFSVNDFTGNDPRYRIESLGVMGQSLELVDNPTEKIIGKLQAKFNLFSPYQATFQVFDDRSQQWHDGTLKTQPAGREDILRIEWNRCVLSMENDPVTWIRGTDQQQNNHRSLLAVVVIHFRRQIDPERV